MYRCIQPGIVSTDKQTYALSVNDILYKSENQWMINSTKISRKTACAFLKSGKMAENSYPLNTVGVIHYKKTENTGKYVVYLKGTGLEIVSAKTIQGATAQFLIKGFKWLYDDTTKRYINLKTRHIEAHNPSNFILSYFN